MTIPFHCPWVPSFVRVVTQSVKQTTCHLRHKETMFCHIFPLHVLVSHFCQTCQTVEFIISFFHLFFPRSKAEKVFRPWWDTLEDYLLNSLVLLGECSRCIGGGATVIFLFGNENEEDHLITATLCLGQLCAFRNVLERRPQAYRIG